jgi:hypothetical protein
MDIDGVSFLRLPFAFHGECDIDLQFVRGQGTNGSRGEQGEGEEEALHFQGEGETGSWIGRVRWGVRSRARVQ